MQGELEFRENFVAAPELPTLAILGVKLVEFGYRNGHKGKFVSVLHGHSDLKLSSMSCTFFLNLPNHVACRRVAIRYAP